MMWNRLLPVMFAEPSICRRYHWPRVSSLHSSAVNVCAPVGKWPQKMIEYAHRLRTRLALALPSSVGRKNGPDSAGNTM
ncbi:Uncharacterised protein [Mycobacteroides abscessus subsp. abscessus]|nr:Uncharacterised protein [Mycobacteroides abscessus subsp. abscessus]